MLLLGKSEQRGAMELLDLMKMGEGSGVGQRLLVGSLFAAWLDWLVLWWPVGSHSQAHGLDNRRWVWPAPTDSVISSGGEAKIECPQR